MDLTGSRGIIWRLILPNVLTIMRLFVGFVFPFVGHSFRIVLLLFAGISDLVDGEISRRLGATTRFGQMLDPVADKAVVLAVAGTFLWEGSIEWWELLLVAMRDVVVTLITFVVPFLKLKHRMETSPLVIGKIATGGQFAYLLTVLLIPQAYTFVFVIAAAISCIAAIAYLQDTFVQVRNLRYG